MSKIVLLAATLAMASCSLSGPGPQSSNRFSDFPQGAVAAGDVYSGAASAISLAFSGGTQSPVGGPCISEPSFGALYPLNFTPPRIEWIADASQNIFELRLVVDNQMNELTVYTNHNDYTMPADVWANLVRDSADHDIKISIRGARLVDSSTLQNGSFLGSTGSVHIAPVSADGAIVYWSTAPTAALKGFRIGDTDVRTVITPEIITNTGRATVCIGCHTSAPDGRLAFFGRQLPTFAVDARTLNTGEAASTDQVSQNAMANLTRDDQNTPTLSRAHYTDSDAVVITNLNHADTGNKFELVYTDLHATTGGTGILARIGDPNQPAMPTWSHDGNSIVYTSAPVVFNARLDKSTGDLWIIPYNNRNGGPASPVPGVNDPGSNQFYPAYSPDDSLLAFNRIPRGENMYNSPADEVWIAPGSGGEPVRVLANDPPICTAQKSPGLTNSWPRWAPSVQTVGGKKYYWLVFSSKRRSLINPANPPQLYMGAVVVDSAGAITTYPAVYITTQPPTESNHTPAWDNFAISAG